LGKLLLINHASYIRRVALLEDEVVREIYVQKPDDRTIVGNIYLGRVQRFLPGINAAFIDIGLERPGFMYAGDARKQVKGVPVAHQAIGPTGGTAGPPPIDGILKIGQSLLVEVTKEPLKTKGPRVSAQLSIAGRGLVYLVGSRPDVGISKKIGSHEDRVRLKKLLKSIKEPEEAIIVRTVSEHWSEGEFTADLVYLRNIATHILKTGARAEKIRCLYQDLDLALRSVRDLVTGDFEGIIVDDHDCFERIKKFVGSYLPAYKSKVFLARDDSPLFEQYGIELDIDRAMDRRVWLASGGHLVIDETEALTTIDVNSGSCAGREDGGDTILRVNEEAAEQAAHQLRLRDIGGIIVIDFIDMASKEHRQKVNAMMGELLRKDRARTHLLPMNDFGLIQFTRERVRDSLGQKLSMPCPLCKGGGTVKSPWTLSIKILGKIEVLLNNPRVNQLQVVGHTDVLAELADTFAEPLDSLQSRFRKKIVLFPREDYDFDQFRIVPQ